MKKFPNYEGQHDRADTVKFFQGYNSDTPPHFHRCIEILYVLDGGVRCKVNGEERVCGEDDVIFVRKCAVHELMPSPRYTDHVLIIGQRYSDDFTNIFRSETLPSFLCDKSFNRSLLPHFQTLADHPDAPELVKKGYIDIIVGSMLAHYPCVPDQTAPNIGTIVAALNYIDEHYREPITLEKISGDFGYNKYYFSRLFNLYIGESLNAYINAIRIQNLVGEAKKTENPNLSELVFSNGFDSMATFYRTFSKYYDCTPKEIFHEK